ncbi:MAG TPA: glycosyltransferase [Flavobacteriaceae bacterium]|nr:glycosyltransferase [Flavobacteriaceae bacterium]
MRVVQIIDSLHPGGSERIAVSMANGLAGKVEVSHICVTREEGILKETICKKVQYLYLNKKSTLDFRAFKKLCWYVETNKINVVHAHSTSYFLATLLKIRFPKLRLIWHNHFGNSRDLTSFRFKLLKACSRFFDASIAVNHDLMEWALQYLKCTEVYYLENFVDVNQTLGNAIQLKGIKGKRIVCLANFRPEKDHLSLLRAFLVVSAKHPDWSLHLIGKATNSSYTKEIKEFICENFLHNVYLYGAQLHILGCLQQADIGVLSSKFEGLPVSLLEYGLAKLAVVCTDVGQCRAFVNNLGILVPPQSSYELAEGLIYFIENLKERRELSEKYYEKIKKENTFESVSNKLLSIYHVNRI